MKVSVHRPRTGKDIGIFERSVVIQMLAAGQLEPDDVAFGDGFTQWVPVSKLQRQSPSLLLQQSLANAGNHTQQPGSKLLAVRRFLASQPQEFYMKCCIFGAVLIPFFMLVIWGNIDTPKYGVPSASRLDSAQAATEVVNSSWDGSVKQVKRWLQDNANDPNSIEFVSWGSVHKKPEGGYWVHCKFRAKNSFGALVIQAMEFHLDNAGNVVKTLNL